jgi:hypothetical protein
MIIVVTLHNKISETALAQHLKHHQICGNQTENADFRRREIANGNKKHRQVDHAAAPTPDSRPCDTFQQLHIYPK